MPLMIEMLYNEYMPSPPSPSRGCWHSLGLVTLTLKSLLEWRYGDQLAATRRH